MIQYLSIVGATDLYVDDVGAGFEDSRGMWVDSRKALIGQTLIIHRPRPTTPGVIQHSRWAYPTMATWFHLSFATWAYCTVTLQTLEQSSSGTTSSFHPDLSTACEKAEFGVCPCMCETARCTLTMVMIGCWARSTAGQASLRPCLEV